MTWLVYKGNKSDTSTHATIMTHCITFNGGLVVVDLQILEKVKILLTGLKGTRSGDFYLFF